MGLLYNGTHPVVHLHWHKPAPPMSAAAAYRSVASTMDMKMKDVKLADALRSGVKRVKSTDFAFAAFVDLYCDFPAQDIVFET